MAKKKPTPLSQEEISQGFINPYELANLLKPENNPEIVRATEYSVKNSNYKTTKDFSIQIIDIDTALLEHIKNNIKPTIIQDGENFLIPVIFDIPEAWETMQYSGGMRDKNGKLMFPLIVLRKNSITKDKTIGNKLDGNRVHLYKTFQNKYTQINQYDNFNSLKSRIPTQDYTLVVIPDYVTISYTITMFTNYIEHMNQLIEIMNFATDSYWGDKERFMFRNTIDSFNIDSSYNQGEDRIIKTTFNLTLNGYIIPPSINKELASIKKSYSKSQIKFNIEIVTNSP
jgi:hypothetical protein